MIAKTAMEDFFLTKKKFATRVSCLLMDSAAVRTVDTFRISEPMLIFNSPKHFIALSLRGELWFLVNSRPGLEPSCGTPSPDFTALFSRNRVIKTGTGDFFVYLLGTEEFDNSAAAAGFSSFGLAADLSGYRSLDDDLPGFAAKSGYHRQRIRHKCLYIHTYLYTYMFH